MLTAASLAIQLLPVAPPRLVGELGVADTGIIYGVYATMGNTAAGQLQAMPSLHVGWAVLIGVAAMQVSNSPSSRRRLPARSADAAGAPARPVPAGTRTSSPW